MSLKVTNQHVDRLLASSHESPVLYVEHDDDLAPTGIDVWAQAHVGDGWVVITRDNLTWRWPSVEKAGQLTPGQLATLQGLVDEVAAL